MLKIPLAWLAHPFLLAEFHWEEETTAKPNPRVCHGWHNASCDESWWILHPPLNPPKVGPDKRAALEGTPPSSNENHGRGVIQGCVGPWCLWKCTADQAMCIQRNFWEGYCSVLACKLNLGTTHYQDLFQVFSCINKSNLLFERCLLTWIFLVLSMVTCSGTIL